MNAIRQSARRMGDFSGRDRRSRFWPYAGVVVGVWFLLYAVAFTLMTVVALTASETVFMVTVFGAMAFFILLLIGLLAAAVVRRLHDVGRSGKWALAPLGLVVISLGLMGLMITSFDQTPETGQVPAGLLIGMIGMSLSNILYMGSLVTLIVFLCLKSQPTPNRFGEVPA